MSDLFSGFQKLTPGLSQSLAEEKTSLRITYIVSILIALIAFLFTFSLLAAILVFGISIVCFIQLVRTARLIRVMCEKNNWTHGVSESGTAQHMQKCFRTLPYGSPSLTHEITGVINNEQFYLAAFSATSGSGKSRRTVRVNVLMLKLEKDIPLKFEIIPEGLFSSSDDIQVESIDFNKKFKIQYDKEKKQDIMKILTPSLQTNLLDIHKLIKIRSVEVQDNVLLFTFTANILYTWSLSPKVSESTIAKVEEKLKRILSFADELSDVFDKS